MKEAKKNTNDNDMALICPDSRPPTFRYPTKVVMFGGVPDLVNLAKFYLHGFCILVF